MATMNTASSQLPKVLLQVNPGLNRQLQTHLHMLEKLKAKTLIASEAKHNLYKSKRENQWEKRKSTRKINLDRESRKVEYFHRYNACVTYKLYITYGQFSLPVHRNTIIFTIIACL